MNGVCLLFNRRMPLVEYEPPVVEGFRQGIRTRPARAAGGRPALAEIPRADADGLHARGARRQWMKRAKARGSRIDVGAVVAATEQENLQDGIDLRVWVSEGLIEHAHSL